MVRYPAIHLASSELDGAVGFGVRTLNAGFALGVELGNDAESEDEMAEERRRVEDRDETVDITKEETTDDTDGVSEERGSGVSTEGEGDEKNALLASGVKRGVGEGNEAGSVGGRGVGMGEMVSGSDTGPGLNKGTGSTAGGVARGLGSIAARGKEELNQVPDCRKQLKKKGGVKDTDHQC